jgi:hypothetical protein
MVLQYAVRNKFANISELSTAPFFKGTLWYPIGYFLWTRSPFSITMYGVTIHMIDTLAWIPPEDDPETR